MCIRDSYPGSPIRQGDSGTAVFTLQRQLNRITKDYPFLGQMCIRDRFQQGCASGRVTAKVVPFSLLRSTVTLPPCSTAISRTCLLYTSRFCC